MTTELTHAVSEVTLKWLRGDIAIKQRLLDVLEKSPPSPESTRAGQSGSQLILRATNLEELHVARKYARAVFGTWSDKLTNRFQNYDGKLCTAFENPNNGLCMICLESPSIEEYPPELMSDNCKWVEKIEPATPERARLAFVCKVPDAPTEG